jgi:ABC-type transporter Mla subunit MlaD
MSTARSHWKLGLFVVGGAALVLASLAFLGARSMQREVGLYVSYFDESVQGLEVGSPIKFRGVTVGTVSRIQVAPDHRHVQVESALALEELDRLGLDRGPEPALFGAPRTLAMAADLRLQLASSGLTDVKFLQLDFFDLISNPSPELPFETPLNMIPTTPSMMKNLGDSLLLVVGRLPRIVAQTEALLDVVDGIVRETAERRFPERIAGSLDRIDALLGGARSTLDRANVAGLSQGASRTLDKVDAAVDHLDELIARVDAKDGLLASVHRASDAVGEALGDARGLGGQLVLTLRSVLASARSLRAVTEALEEDPDMFVKGRSPEARR